MPPEKPEPQPVLFVLFARFENHMHMAATEQRLFRLFQFADRVRKEQPGEPFKVVCEFSGAIAERLAESNPQNRWVDRIKEAARDGWLEIGYSGRHEPTYRNRPRAALRDGMKPEERWLARSDAAGRFLTEHKDFVTGNGDATRSGGLKRVAEVFGPPVFAADFSEQIAGETPHLHHMRKMGLSPVISGFPDPHFYLNIHGYRDGKAEFAKGIAPDPNTSPEVLWDTNFLRLSFSSYNDIRMFRTVEGPAELEKLLAKLDRARIRILQMEVLDEERYLNLWPDGTPRLHPLAWAYDHPDDPIVPAGIRAFQNSEVVEQTFAKDFETMAWLFGRFLRENPGSRIVGIRDIKRAAATPLDTTLDAATVKEAAKAFLDAFARTGKSTSGFVRAGGHYLTAADLFYLLANALGGNSQTIRLGHLQGPLFIDMKDNFMAGTAVRAGEIARAAAALIPKLNDQTWRSVPANAVPSAIPLAGKQVSPVQFLKLMAEAYLAGASNKPLTVEYLNGWLLPGMLFPRHIPVTDASNLWTLRPAPLRLEDLQTSLRSAR